jgi:hypothetical protein
MSSIPRPGPALPTLAQLNDAEARSALLLSDPHAAEADRQLALEAEAATVHGYELRQHHAALEIEPPNHRGTLTYGQLRGPQHEAEACS